MQHRCQPEKHKVVNVFVILLGGLTCWIQCLENSRRKSLFLFVANTIH